MQAVVPSRPDDEREVDLRSCDGPPGPHSSSSESRRNSPGSAPRRARRGLRPSSASAASGALAVGDAGELERVGERLAPVRERGLGDAPGALELGAPGLRPAEGDERRVDVGRRPEARSRHRMEARALDGQLEDAPTPPRSPSCPASEEAVGDLPLHHHAPELDGRQAPRALSTTTGVATLYGRLATSFAGGGSKPVCRSASASPKTSSTFSQPCEPFAKRGLERSGRARPHARARRGRPGTPSTPRGRGRSRARCRQPRARPAFRSRGGCSRRRASAGPALVSAGCSRQGEERGGVLLDLLLERAASSPRASARAATVCWTNAGSFRLPRTGCGARYGAVGLGEQPLGGDPCRRPAELRRLRVGHVACEGHVPAVLESRLEQRRTRRSSGGRRAGRRGSARELRDRVRLGGARVDDEGLPDLGSELRLRAEAPTPAGLAARDRGSDRARSRRRPPPSGASRSSRSSSTSRSPTDPASCGWSPSAANTPASSLAESQRRPAGLDAGSNRDHPLDPCRCARSRTAPASSNASRCACVSIIVRRLAAAAARAHAAAVGASTRGKSGSAGSIPLAATVFPAATPSHAGSIGWPSASRIRSEVLRE